MCLCVWFRLCNDENSIGLKQQATTVNDYEDEDGFKVWGINIGEKKKRREREREKERGKDRFPDVSVRPLALEGKSKLVLCYRLLEIGPRLAIVTGKNRRNQAIG
ncbi:hypothetical protein HZH66_012939 [Vespula vulgaris]|uniref:Uncharacterized protein n=1 Tax=Vespula vulgaris TaxID=7454 RepID=A0A834J839_VESVU|nr:hypothetical protein HZH66_012939 [Vespula vulgaris]